MEELLPACFEPDTTPVTQEAYTWIDGANCQPWELRRDVRDDRVLIFSRNFTPVSGKTVLARYAVRVVSAGKFAMPGTTVTAMYAPDVRARGAAGRITIER